MRARDEISVNDCPLNQGSATCGKRAASDRQFLLRIVVTVWLV